MERPLTVCQFGHYVRDYSRNRLLRAALAELGAAVVEVHDETPSWLRRSGRLRSKWGDLAPAVVLVSFPGGSDMPMARLLSRRSGATVVYDAFISQFDTQVHDRRTHGSWSAHGRYFYAQDWLACRLADVVLTDTALHADYFATTFRVDRKKFVVVPVGTDATEAPPLATRDVPPYDVVWYGSYLPLQGAPVIAEAARLLDERGVPCTVTLIGDGPDRPAVSPVVRRLTNVRMVDRLPLGDLHGRLATADLTLGVFGTTAKAQRVVPNKVYDALALGRPVLTGDTPAIRAEFAVDEELAVCTPGDPHALAGAIQALLADPARREGLGRAGRKAHLERYTVAALARALRPALSR